MKYGPAQPLQHELEKQCCKALTKSTVLFLLWQHYKLMMITFPLLRITEREDDFWYALARRHILFSFYFSPVVSLQVALKIEILKKNISPNSTVYTQPVMYKAILQYHVSIHYRNYQNKILVWRPNSVASSSGATFGLNLKGN